MDKYVILKTESQKDGTNFSVMTEKKAKEMIDRNYKWKDQFEIVADVTQSIKFILSSVSISSPFEEMLKEMLNDCEYIFDYATVPKDADMTNPQICGSLIMSYQRYLKAKRVIGSEC